MCNDQFGNWITGCVEVIALIGACLDVFWFDPLKWIPIAWRRASVCFQIAFQLSFRMLEMPSFFRRRIPHSGLQTGFSNSPEVENS
jgi:hypothetical protein